MIISASAVAVGAGYWYAARYSQLTEQDESVIRHARLEEDLR